MVDAATRWAKGKFSQYKDRIRELEVENEALCESLEEAEDRINEMRKEIKRLIHLLTHSDPPV